MKIQKHSDEWVASWKDIKITDKSLMKAIAWCMWGIKTRNKKELEAKKNANVQAHNLADDRSVASSGITDPHMVR